MTVNVLRPFQGNSPSPGQRVMLDPSSIVIGDVLIGDDASIWPLVVARGDVNRIIIGARSNIQDGCVLHVTHRSPANPQGYPLVIGNDVTVGHKAMLHGCTLCDRVLVGMGSIILDNAYIEEDVIIGAGSLVPPGKRLVSGYLYLGSPVRQIRRLTDDEVQSLLYSAANYVKWKDVYLSEQSQNQPSSSS